MAKKQYFQESDLVFEEKPKLYNFKDIEGQVFGRLKVLGYAGSSNGARWYCRCICGNVTKNAFNHLNDGKILSCGCLGLERRIKGCTKHGHSAGDKVSKTYGCWQGMLSRCYNDVSNFQFPNYGGRGIAVCERWHKFENFLADMGEKPKDLSLDRIDVNGNYEPTNCRWATMKTQQNNRRGNHFLTFCNKTQTIMQWSEEVGIGGSTIRYRIKKSWPIERALTEPVKITLKHDTE